MDPVSIRKHNDSVDLLWEAYGRGCNERVPITFMADESLWLKLAGERFDHYYENPRVQLRVQLEGAAWFSENIVHDRRLGPPDGAWTITPSFWMDEAEYFGCEITLQSDSFAWSRPLRDGKPDLLRRLQDLDPLEGVKRTRRWRLYEAMRDLAEGMVFRGLPVRVTYPAGGSHGLFTVATHVRGVETLCLDLIEAPDFVDKFLRLLSDKLIGKAQALAELNGSGATFPNATGWGCADDAIQLLSSATYRSSVLPHHERLYAAFTSGRRSLHLCGHAAQHYRAIHESLGIVDLDGPGPFADHGAMLAEMPSLSLAGQVDHTVLLLGPPPAIDGMLRTMLTDAAKQPGRYTLAGYVGPALPLSHVQAMYEAGVRRGAIQT